MVLLSKHLNDQVDYKLELLDNNNDWGQTVLNTDERTAWTCMLILMILIDF